MKLAVHFGAGNIGRGFIAPTLQANNYEVIFVDVNTDLIEQINSEGQYSIKSLSLDGIRHEEIKLSLIHISEPTIRYAIS